jgi:hypothetical protein
VPTTQQQPCTDRDEHKRGEDAEGMQFGCPEMWIVDLAITPGNVPTIKCQSAGRQTAVAAGSEATRPEWRPRRTADLSV